MPHTTGSSAPPKSAFSSLGILGPLFLRRCEEGLALLARKGPVLFRLLMMIELSVSEVSPPLSLLSVGGFLEYAGAGWEGTVVVASEKFSPLSESPLLSSAQRKVS